ncbi:MAG: hypothetical protein AABY53_05445 [Bdellovibrionota bacterium]
MKNTITHHFYLTSVLLIITTASFSAKAEKFKVKKVKGNQAVIETTTVLEEDQTYEFISESVSQDVDYKSNVLKSRENSLTLGGEFNFLRASNYQSNTYSLQVRYGWNFSSVELGALLNMVSTDVGAGATTTVLGGGYFDYNLIANRDPKKVI